MISTTSWSIIARSQTQEFFWTYDDLEPDRGPSYIANPADRSAFSVKKYPARRTSHQY
jgi:hypothetical protein